MSQGPTAGTWQSCLASEPFALNHHMTRGPESTSQWSARPSHTHLAPSLISETTDRLQRKNGVSQKLLYFRAPPSHSKVCGKSQGLDNSQTFLTLCGTWAPHQRAHHAGDLQLRQFLKAVPGHDVESRLVSHSLVPFQGTGTTQQLAPPASWAHPRKRWGGAPESRCLLVKRS